MSLRHASRDDWFGPFPVVGLDQTKRLSTLVLSDRNDVTVRDNFKAGRDRRWLVTLGPMEGECLTRDEAAFLAMCITFTLCAGLMQAEQRKAPPRRLCVEVAS